MLVSIYQENIEGKNMPLNCRGQGGEPSEETPTFKPISTSWSRPDPIKVWPHCLSDFSASVTFSTCSWVSPAIAPSHFLPSFLCFFSCEMALLSFLLAQRRRWRLRTLQSSGAEMGKKGRKKKDLDDWRDLQTR